MDQGMPVEFGAEARGPLAGIRVLDLSSVVSGPLCAQVLGDLGADVVKLEPLGGETARRLGMPMNEGISPLFAGCNRNKRSIAVDLKSERGVAVARRVAAKADVLVENYRPDVAPRLGLGYETLSEANPGLIYVSISGFGPDGPYSQLPAYDTVIQGLTGFLPVQGEAIPRLVQCIAADKTTALTAVYGVTTALFARERGDGRGQHVHVPMLDAYAAYLLPDLLGTKTFPAAPPMPTVDLHRTWATRDGYVVMMIVEDSQFFGICRALGRDDLIEDPRCANLIPRILHSEELFAILAGEIRKQPTDELVARCRVEGAPVAPVNDLDDFLADPQVAANHTVFEIDGGPGVGNIRMARQPVRLPGTPATVRRPPPRLGEHTDAVLTEIGLGADEIATLRAEGVLA